VKPHASPTPTHSLTSSYQLQSSFAKPPKSNVHAANIHDTKSSIEATKLVFERYPTIEKFCGDQGYQESFQIDVFWEFGIGVDISERIKPEFKVLPKRWVVEHIFTWLGNSRRLSKDYEISIDSEENMVCISHLHMLLRRLA